VRRKAPFSPLIYGGHQERNLRGGTECVPLIVGMGKAAELARKHLPNYEKKVRPLRDALEEGILGPRRVRSICFFERSEPTHVGCYGSE
jgi:cysteine desulfurase